jgi:ubiquinol-cytochrome c reductase cytochrome b subunit
MYLGLAPAEGLYVLLARIFTVVYFAYFLLFLPFAHKFETIKPLPERLTYHAH